MSLAIALSGVFAAGFGLTRAWVMMAQMFVYTGGSHRHFDSGTSMKQTPVYCSIFRLL